MTWNDLIKRLNRSGKAVVADFDDSGPSDGYFWHRGLISNSLGVFPAWILKDHMSSGEHSGTIVRIGDSWKVQGFDDLPTNFFPYKYRLNVPCDGDIHDSEMF